LGSGSGTLLYELDLTNYVWHIPNSSGQIPNRQIGHRANVIGKYMVISFGKYIFDHHYLN